MKNKILIVLSLLTTLTLPLTAKAGTEMHGGDSVVCFQNIAEKQKVETILRQNKLASQMGYIRQDPFANVDMDTITVETLDLWETHQTLAGPKEFVEIENINDGLKDRIEAMKNKLMAIANILEEADRGFYNPSKWLASATGIVEIDDSHELINYTNLCIPVQIAVQTDTRVYYDGRLFSKLDPLNKVALILHEYLYSWAKTFTNSSLNVRKYIGLLMLKNFEIYPVEELRKEMEIDFKASRDLKFERWIKCQLTSVIEDESFVISYIHGGVNQQVCQKRDERYYTNDFKIIESDRKQLSEKLGLKLDGEVNGEWKENIFHIQSLKLANGEKLTVNTVTPFTYWTYYHYLQIKEGNIQLPYFPQEATHIQILGQDIEMAMGINGGITSGDKLEYKKTSSGKLYLYKIRIGSDMKLKSAGFKKTKKCDKYDYVTFNEQGLVIDCN